MAMKKSAAGRIVLIFFVASFVAVAALVLLDSAPPWFLAVGAVGLVLGGGAYLRSRDRR